MTRTEYRARLRGRRMFLGMDLSSTKDLSTIVGVCPDDVGVGFDVLAQFFVPQDTIQERSRRDKVKYDEWARQEYLIPTPGNVIDYEYIRQEIKRWGAEFQIREIAFDPWNATDLVTRLQEQDGFTCAAMRQGFASLSAPTKALEKAILSKALRHDGHPVLRWNISNVSVETDATGNLKISKKVSTERIDGVAALVMAIDRMDHGTTQEPRYSMLILGGAR